MFPVRVYVRPSKVMGDYLGYFRLHGTTHAAIIAVSDATDKTTLLDTLCEEWAHARTYNLGTPAVDRLIPKHLPTQTGEDPHHHPTFWAEYGRIQTACRARDF